MSTPAQSLIDKLQQLPAERLEEVEDFIDFLRAREDDRTLVQVAGRMSEQALARVWDNPEDSAYDAL
jgi:hypothetical protein